MRDLGKDHWREVLESDQPFESRWNDFVGKEYNNEKHWTDNVLTFMAQNELRRYTVYHTFITRQVEERPIKPTPSQAHSGSKDHGKQQLPAAARTVRRTKSSVGGQKQTAKPREPIGPPAKPTIEKAAPMT